MSSVGRSWVTPLKHDLMNRMVGQEVGAMSRGAFRDVSRLFWYDLTAGDAAPVKGSEWSKSCSVGILASHAAWEGNRKPVLIHLYEAASRTYGTLLENLTEQLPVFGWTRYDDDTWTHPNGSGLHAFPDSGETADLSSVGRSSAVLAFNDPNSVHGWAMRPGFAAEVRDRGVPWLRTLSTLGCNVSGLKRLERDQREGWYDFPEQIRKGTPGYRDMILAAVDRDSAQWAYLISTAARWREETEKHFSQSAGRLRRTMSTAWWRQEPEKFAALTNQLFLTRGERG